MLSDVWRRDCSAVYVICTGRVYPSLRALGVVGGVVGWLLFLVLCWLGLLLR